jgi:hypothetical protein
MIGMWWWIWLGFMFVFLLSPVGYGWGYRGWGPPYPSYYQRRRGERAAGTVGAAFDHRAWGRGGDVVWGLGVFWVLMAIVVFFWL